MMKKIVLVAGLVLALFAPHATHVDAASTDTYRQLNLFGDVFERVRAEYVEEVSDEELIEAAIRGMLSSLDPHSSYLNPESFGEMQVQTRGEFGGLGIEVTMEDGFVRVVSPIDDTPAFRAGIEAGDLITHLDGEPILGMTLGDAVDRMRGPVNTDIVLTVLREGADEPLEITITRDIIVIQSVRSRIEDKVGYIRITSFNEQADEGVQEALEEIKAELGDELQGIVLDLRNNPGGLLDQAIAVSDAFLDQGEIVSTRGRRPDSSQRFNARAGDLAEGLPIVVLINGGSASASEIVAGALQDHRRAIIMGTDSFGKGSVQTIIPLPGHGAMRLTTARYYTPSGVSIQAKGIVPDIYVATATIDALDESLERHEADLRNSLDAEGTEEDIDDAVGEEVLDENIEEEISEEEAAFEESGRSEQAREDYQLNRALDLLEGLYLLQDVVAQNGQ